MWNRDIIDMYPLEADRFEEIIEIGIEVQVPDVKIAACEISSTLYAYLGRNLVQCFLDALKCGLTLFLWS